MTYLDPECRIEGQCSGTTAAAVWGFTGGCHAFNTMKAMLLFRQWFNWMRADLGMPPLPC